MRILVCGGRDYTDRNQLEFVLSHYVVIQKRPITCLVTGAASGADTLAASWAQKHGISVKEYPAEWGRLGKSAGHIRNQAMLDDNPDIALVVAFPGGRGTADMVRRAKQRGLEVFVVKENGDWDHFPSTRPLASSGPSVP